MGGFLSPEQIDSFNDLLDGYKPNPEALERFRGSNFGVIAGPVAAGKDTLREGLIGHNPQSYIPILSTTTRPKREDEKDGVDYHFKSIKEVEAGLKAGNYMQGDLVHNQQIATLDVAEIKKLGQGQTGLSILIVKTEQDLHAINPRIKTVFLTPPSLAALLERLQTTRNFSVAETDRRLTAARAELEIALANDRYYCLISEDKDANIVRAHAFFQDGTIDEQADSRARESIARLLDEFKHK
jgi:guanylate kinase